MFPSWFCFVLSSLLLLLLFCVLCFSWYARIHKQNVFVRDRSDINRFVNGYKNVIASILAAIIKGPYAVSLIRSCNSFTYFFNAKFSFRFFFLFRTALWGKIQNICRKIFCSPSNSSFFLFMLSKIVLWHHFCCCCCEFLIFFHFVGRIYFGPSTAQQ